MSKVGLYIKMGLAASVMAIGPALVYYVSPTDEELFKAYNPELQKRSLENRQQRQEEINNFYLKLKEYSRSDKSVWEEAKIQEAKAKATAAEEQRRQAMENQKQKDEVKKQSLGYE